jgi:hypothetical protein
LPLQILPKGTVRYSNASIKAGLLSVGTTPKPSDTSAKTAVTSSFAHFFSRGEFDVDWAR